MKQAALSGGSRQDPWGRLVLGKGRRCSHQALELGQSDMGQGFKDLLVVHTPDATLVADKRDEESVRKLVALLKERGWESYL